ncbi:MAG: radical SAM protein [Lutisporaceae bacterium]
MGDKSIKPAPWISYRNYFFDTQESRSIISNEKAHTFLLLEGEAASIFAKLTSGCSYGEFREYAEEIGVSEELEDFVAQLFQEGLLIIDDVYFIPGQAQNDDLDTAYSGQAIKSDEYEEFIRDMNKWAWSKGLFLSAHWDMTYNCNENCIHCYNRCFNTNQNNSKELTTEEAFVMIDDMFEAGVFILTLSGGEAALRQDYFDILGYARSKRMCVQLLSNGLIWDADFSKKVASYWPNMVGISIYSANPVLHDEVTRVPGSFEASVAALKYLKEAGIQTELRSVQLRETLKGYENTKKLAVELGIKSVLAISIMPALDGNLQPVEQSANVFNELVVLAATEGTPLSVKYIKNAFDESGKPKDMERSVCAAGKHSLHFDPTGNINPCVAIPIVMGNIKDVNLKKFWLDSLDLKYIRNIRLKDIEPCGTEAYCKYCMKVCPGSSFLEKGSFFTAPEVSCLEAKARKMAAELLSQGLSRDEICTTLDIPVEFGYI